MKLAVLLFAYYELFVGAAEVVNQNTTGSLGSLVSPFASLPSLGSFLPGNSAYEDLAVGAIAWYIGHHVL